MSKPKTQVADEDAAAPELPKIGQSVFVLTGDTDETMQILFKTTVKDVVLQDTLKVAVVEEGLTFIDGPDGWRTQGASKVLTLLPDDDQTVDLVRRYTRQQRAERHAHREAKKTHQARVDQALHTVQALQYRINEAKRNLRDAQRDLKYAEEHAARYRQRVQQLVEHNETGIPTLEDRLVDAKANLARIKKEPSWPSSTTTE